MTEETLRVLEYDKIKTILAGFTATGPGRELARGLRPLEDVAAIESSLAEVGEAAHLIPERGAPPVGGSRDLRPSLVRLRAEGAWLPAEGLLEVLSSLEAAVGCRRYFGDAERSPRLAGRAAGLEALPELRQQIRAAIGSRGEVLDSASFELGELRRDIQQTRTRIRRSLERLLAADSLAGAFQERIITERSGRYVVPVRADHRGQVKGFVHDESASGQTLFVEPASVLEANNHLHAQLREEQREIERILRRLSALVRRDSEALSANLEILARLDLVAAAARLSLATESASPQLCSQPVLELRGARHPLLLLHADGTPREGGAVPIDLLLGEDRDVLVISGPNTGGKTVGLKTAGLLVLMVRSGLPIPCRPDSRLHLFRHVFADIGDEQSIEENLSTFSGHLVRLRGILEKADGDSLVLLDEAGTGTDPGEGAALALAVLDRLRSRGTRIVVTTHLNLLKSWAHLHEGVENAAVEFDSRTLAPSYRLHYGIPGASNAFTIARRLGLPEEVLQGAEAHLGEGERQGLDLIEEMNRLRREAEDDREESRRLLAEARRERDRRKALLAELEEQRRGILEKASRKGEARVREAERTLKDLLQEARHAAAPPQRARLAAEVEKVREEVAGLKPAPVRKGQRPAEVRAGEILRVPALNAEGEVVRVQDGQAELSVGGKKLRLPLSDLEQFSPRRFAPSRRGAGKVRSSVERQGFQPRLVLVGERAEAALLRLDRFIDDALLHGSSEVEIVHGAGEGVLRRAVRDFLAGHREVSSFHAADLKQGGDNVTVAVLRGG